MPAIGTAFQLKGSGFHFWIVISSPKNGKVLVVNLTDERHNHDQTCRLAPSDYCELTKPSVVFYKQAQEWNADKIDAEVLTEKYLRRLADCPSEIVRRIVYGARTSEEFKPKFLVYLQ
jgi:hypothetical protein